MKRILLIISLTFFSSLFIQAQDVRKHTVKINLHAPFFNSFYMAYEHVIAPDIAVGSDLFIIGHHYDDVKWSGFGISPEIKFYFKSDSYKGYYLAPNLRYQHIKITDRINVNNGSGDLLLDREGKYNIFGLGINIGHNFVFNDRVCIDFYAGPQFQRKSISGEARPRSLYCDAVYWGRVGMNIGFKF